MNRQRLLQLVVAALPLTAMGCATHSQPAISASRAVQLVVHNSNTSDVNFYVMSGTTRVRLGTARSMATSRLTVPATYLAASSGMILQADPIGSTASFTFPGIHAAPNDRVEIQVGSALQLSSFAVYTR